MSGIIINKDFWNKLRTLENITKYNKIKKILWHSSFYCEFVLLVSVTSYKIFVIHLLYFRHFYWKGACKGIYGLLQHLR